MKMIPQISLLLSLSLLPLLSYCFINPDGQWTYMEGSGYGPMYLCLGANNGSILTGSYSEFGYVRGTFKRSTRTVTGKWFEIGLTDSEGLAASGYFTWVFDKEFTYFTGSYYHDGQDPSEAQDWSETHIDFMKPTNLQCFRYANSDDSLNGKWVWDSTRMYLSQNGVGTLSSYYNSSLVSPDSPGYSEGTCDSYYQVCHGQIQRPDYYGQIMFVLGRHKLLYITAFEGSWDDDSLNIPDQLNGNHLLTNATLRASYNLTEEEAAQYQVILFQGSFMGTPSDLSSDYIPFVTNVGTDNAISGYYFESSVLRGTYDWMSRTLSGLWFDPGLEYPMNTYTTGTFEFAMSEDWGSIVGSFSDYRIGETEPYATAPWGPFFRASFALPSNSAAMYDASSPSTPISGTFTGDWSLYLCASDNSFKASFIIEKTGQVGYAVGRCGPLYKVCNGDFISSSQRGELLITVLTDTTIQIDYYYATFLNIPEPSLRNSVTLTLQTSDVTSEECATNLYLPFVGNFTDPVYGYTYYISYDPIARLLNGFYSELGVTRGAINRDTEKWEARWVEPGLYYENSSNPTSGYVYFELVTLDSFDGTFFFDDDLFRALQWGTVNRISYVTPTNAQAWVDTAYNTPLNGTWFTANNDKIWFCEYYEGSPDPNLDHPYAMAFSWNVTADEPLTHGRSEGVCSYQTRVCHGTWESENGDSGVLILSLADQNNLRLSSFTGEMSSQVTSQIGNATLHRVTTYSRLITYATDEECHQYDGAASVGVGFVGLFVCVLASLLW